MKDHVEDIVFERGRTAGHGNLDKGVRRNKQRAWKSTDSEGFPKRESSAKNRLHGYDSKRVNPHYAIIRGFLQKNVGKNWDDVYSEFCEAVKKGTYKGNHIHDSLNWQVAKPGEFYLDEEGIPCYNKRSIYGVSIHHHFYVHPETNKLTINKGNRNRYRRPKVEPPKDKFYKESDTKVFRQNEETGIWYELTMEKVPPLTYQLFWTSWAYGYSHRFSDAWFGIQSGYFDGPWSDQWNNETIYAYGTREYYCKSKRQLNKREIRRIRRLIAERDS